MAEQDRARPSDDGKSFLPLTRGQRAMWFLYQMKPDSGAYNCTYGWHVRSEIDVDALRNVLYTLAARHPFWRATYEMHEGEVKQVVHEAALPIFEEISAQAWHSQDVMAELEREIYRPYALDREPPVRWRLYRRSEDDPILVFAMHHLACDGWSCMTALHELRTLYAAEVGGESVTLPELTLTNSDFVHAQEEMLAGEEGAAHLAYWQERLGGELSDLNLATDFPRPVTPGVKTGLVRRNLDKGLTDDLLKLAKSLRVSPFKFFLSAYQVFLYRYTRQEGFCVGVATAGRGQKFGGIFDFFVNTVAVLAQIDGGCSFEEFLQQNAPRISGDLRHQAYPFTDLVSTIAKERDTSRTPIYQATFVWENFNIFLRDEPPFVSMNEAGNEAWDLGLIKLERIPINLTVDHFDLDFKFVQAGDVFYIQADYNAELFARETFCRFVDNFNRLLESIRSDVGSTIAALPILTEAERRQVLHDFNDSNVDASPPYFHQVVARHGLDTPAAPAVVFEDRDMSYQQLDSRAERLADFLQNHGVGPDVIVGISMERGRPEQIVAVIGILKAGGAYFPLDPDYPDDRLSFMLEDAEVSLILTQERCLERLAGFEVETVAVDSDAWKITGGRKKGPGPGAGTNRMSRSRPISWRM